LRNEALIFYTGGKNMNVKTTFVGQLCFIAPSEQLAWHLLMPEAFHPQNQSRT
jgi:hypothetical protein